jgi:chitinase
MKLISVALLLLFANTGFAQTNSMKVIGYFSGGTPEVDNVDAKKLTHIIFSFCHLKGNNLTVDSKKDSITISKLVALKKINPQLKVMLSLGGWGGCGPCSDVFASAKGREDFAESTLALNKLHRTDGIDLDWEYPTIEGYPKHTYRKEDRENFSDLVKVLRKKMGQGYEISFAAGGFKKYLEESVDWQVVMPLVDRVNLMSYDLVNGYSTVTGHHTPLYSDKKTPESTDFGVQYLISHGVPKNKIVIGGAFYARVWENVPNENHGLYQPGKFKAGIDFKRYEKEFSKENGFEYFWDDNTKASYFYNKEKGLFATGDDKKSIGLKTKYTRDQGLQGIMFWELTSDTPKNGLLAEIDRAKSQN